MGTTKVGADKIAQLEKTATQVRRDIVRMVNNCGSGHPGGALGCTDYLVALYHEVMTHDPKNFTMDALNEDVFYLSNGHICAVLYSTLARAGYFDVSELSTHRFINSRLQGHPATAKGLEGVRMASGSLGQGLSVGIGTAQTKKLNGEDKFVYVLMGDGELQEGQIWEAAMYAAHNKVDNIIAAVDYNNAQIDGTVDNVLNLLDLSAKWKSFGWEVIELEKGNDMTAVLSTIEEAQAKAGNGKPVVIIMTTKMGAGVDFMESAENAWHGKAPNAEQTEQALSQLEETIGDF